MVTVEYDVVTYRLPVHLIEINGRLDAQTAPALKERLKAMTRAGHHHLIIDQRAAAFIDSAGLGVLTSLLRASRAAGGDLHLVVSRDAAVFDILSVVHFDVVFTFYETPQDALHNFPA
jgi:anti-anti-sigma factor